MKLKWNVFLTIFLCWISIFSAFSQNKKVASFPFKMMGSYIVITAKINNSTSLNLILDSGIRHTLVSELFEDDNVRLSFLDTISLQGLGNQRTLKALRSNNNTLKIGKLTLKNSTVFFLENDIFNLSTILGQKVNGILGSEIFRQYVVDINYTMQRINIYQPETFLAPDKYDFLPMDITAQSKMLIDVNVKTENDEYKKVKMLLDTGAETTAWLQAYGENAVETPEKKVYGLIGEGLNGEITGNFGKLKELCIGGYCIPNPIVAFPDSAAISDVLQSRRDGSLGSQILKRFNMIFDYKNKKFYFTKNRFFKDQFQYNIAGLELVQTVLFFPVFEVNKVWKNSNAQKAGIQTGDMIFEIDGQKTFTMTLSEIKSIFSRPSKSPLHLTIKRQDDFLKVKLDMRSEL